MNTLNSLAVCGVEVYFLKKTVIFYNELSIQEGILISGEHFFQSNLLLNHMERLSLEKLTEYI